MCARNSIQKTRINDFGIIKVDKAEKDKVKAKKKLKCHFKKCTLNLQKLTNVVCSQVIRKKKKINTSAFVNS